MSLMHPHVFAYSPSPIALYSATEYASQTCPITFRHVTKPRKFHFPPQPIETHFISNNSPPPKTYPSAGAVQTMASEGANLDAILSIVEVLCISSAVLVTISYAVNCTFSGSKRTVLEVIGSHGAFAWGMVVLVGGVAVGAWIRRRQSGSSIGVVEVTERLDLVGSVNKLEEDLKSSVTIIRVLSRQLEKLGIRFRLTRKALKEPIAEHDCWSFNYPCS